MNCLVCVPLAGKQGSRSERSIASKPYGSGAPALACWPASNGVDATARIAVIVLSMIPVVLRIDVILFVVWQRNRYRPRQGFHNCTQRSFIMVGVPIIADSFVTGDRSRVHPPKR